MKPIALVMLLASCADLGPTDECVGGLRVRLAADILPANVRVEFAEGTAPLTPVVVLDECEGLASYYAAERESQGGAIVIDGVTFGLRPPEAYSIAVYDRATCADLPRLLLRAIDVPVTTDPVLCEVITHELPLDLPIQSELNTCGPERPDGLPCTAPASCTVSNWEHECDCTCQEPEGTWSCTPLTVGSQCAEPPI